MPINRRLIKNDRSNHSQHQAVVVAVKNNNMKHFLKTRKEFFDQTVAGVKNFRFSIKDRNFKVGDTVCLQEIIYATTPQGNFQFQYTGRTIERKINYVLPVKEVVGNVAQDFVVLDVAENSHLNESKIDQVQCKTCLQDNLINNEFCIKCGEMIIV